MGAVYEVSHIETLGQLALKVMLPQVVSNADLRARFQLEAKATAQIRSDHVVKVWDTGVDAATGLPFLVMELLKGEDLGALLARRGSPMPVPDVLELLDQARHGLDKIHAADVVHRDITPQNLVRTERDDHSPCLKIIDFGIAKVVDESTYPRTTCGFGTRLYAAPEQLLGAGTIGSGADLYSLAHVAFTLLSGKAYWEPEHVLFAGGYQFVQRVLGGTKIPGSQRAGDRLSGFAKEFDRWFARATALDPAERFETASELVEELFAVFGVPPPRRREAQRDFTQAAEAPIAGADPLLVEDDAQLSQSRTSTAAVAASAQVQSRRRRHVYPFVAGAALAMAIAGVLLSVGRPAAESPRRSCRGTSGCGSRLDAAIHAARRASPRGAAFPGRFVFASAPKGREPPAIGDAFGKRHAFGDSLSHAQRSHGHSLMRARYRPANKLWGFGSLVALALLAPPAFAQRSPTDPIAAEALFNAAKEALRQGDWGGACDKFQKSMDLDPSVSTLVKGAKCQQHDGKLATAWYGYQRALKMNREADYSERRRDELEKYIAAAAAELEPRLSKLRVVVVPAPNGVQVYRDNELISSAILGESVPVDPGEHAITARAPGCVDVQQIVTIREAETAQVSLSLTQVPQAVAPSPSKPPDSTGDPAPPVNPESKGNIAPDRPSKGPNPADTRSPWRTVAFVVGGAGIAALGTAGFFGIRTLDLVSRSNSTCYPDGCDPHGYNLRKEARDSQTIALVLAGSGVAALGIGITLVAVTPRNRHRNDTADAARFGMSLTPSLIVVHGSF